MIQKIYYLIVLSCLSAVPTGLAIELTPSEEISLAYTLVKAKRYTDAVLRVQPLLDALKLDTIETIVKGNKVLSISYCELGEKEKAQDTLGTVLAFSPNEPFSEFPLSKECMTFFGVKKPEPKTMPKRSVEKPLPTLALSENAPIEVKQAPATEIQTKPIDKTFDIKSEPTDAWKLYMPMGAGQFYNHQPQKGYAFMSSQILGLVTGITMFALFKSSQNDDGTFSNTGRAHLYKNIYWSSIGLTASSTVWGLIDGWLVHKKKSRDRIPKLEPVDRSSGVTADSYEAP